mmetsp:Transcript_124647/g.358020  ORF Transcript_124647/g.358020 Transcript_124647/m.358020 type:complete len:218 (-) Transcript_124647:46-699(-)
MRLILSCSSFFSRRWLIMSYLRLCQSPSSLCNAVTFSLIVCSFSAILDDNFSASFSMPPAVFRCFRPRNDSWSSTHLSLHFTNSFRNSSTAESAPVDLLRKSMWTRSANFMCLKPLSSESISCITAMRLRCKGVSEFGTSPLPCAAKVNGPASKAFGSSCSRSFAGTDSVLEKRLTTFSAISTVGPSAKSRSFLRSQSKTAFWNKMPDKVCVTTLSQ